MADNGRKKKFNKHDRKQQEQIEKQRDKGQEKWPVDEIDSER